MASEIVGLRLTDQRAAQIAALEAMTGLEGPAAVIDFALATTLAHYGAQEDTMTVRNILYQYEADDSAQFGPDADLSEIDIRASYNAYEDAVLGALQAAYPGARVSVQSGPHRVSVNHDRDHEELPAVGEIIGKVWQSFDWLREA